MAASANAESSLRDDLEASLRSIEEREAAPSNDDTPAPQADADIQVTETETETERSDGRDAHGRFVSKTAAEAAPEGAADEGSADGKPSAPAPQETPASTADQDASATQEDTAPKSWRADEAKAWTTVPPEARAAILRREAEAAKLAGANDAERMFGREVAEIVRPFAGAIQQAGVSPQQALKVLFDNHKVLSGGNPEEKTALARRMLQEYGIDPRALAQPDPNIPSDPHVLGLQRHIAQLEARLNAPQDQQFAPLPPSEAEYTVQSQIEAFRADPAHPHFDAVQNRMGQLLETGAASDLSEAYLMAVAANPALRSTAHEPQRTTQDKTLAARRASASVTGSPGPTGTPTPTNLRDELQEQLRQHGWV